MSDPTEVTSDIGLIAKAIDSTANMITKIVPSDKIREGRFEINHPWLYARAKRHLIRIIRLECKKHKIPADHIPSVVKIFAGDLPETEQSDVVKVVTVELGFF